jgi:hypothetical protein
MVLRIVLLSALIAAALVVVRQQEVLENAGLIGYCTEVATPTGHTGVWHECHSGKLTGTPGLPLASCKRMRHSADTDLWRCPVGIGSNRARQ